MKIFLGILVIIAASVPQCAQAAVGCTLSNPAEDLKYLFPEMSSYKEELRNFSTMKDGEKWFQNLKERIGSDLDPVYENFDTPYTVYSVFKARELIGLVHGVNVPGKGGVIQVFLSLDPKTAEIKSFFFQRLESPVAKALRRKEFREQFKGLSLADFYKHDYFRVVEPSSEQDRVEKVRPPDITAEGRPDYDASLRGIRKNLVLMDFFIFGERFEPFYVRAKEALAKAQSPKSGK